MLVIPELYHRHGLKLTTFSRREALSNRDADHSSCMLCTIRYWQRFLKLDERLNYIINFNNIFLKI